MGISVGGQGLTCVVDEFFSDEKGSYVFNYLNDLVVYSRSVEDNEWHVRTVLQWLKDAGFTLNPEKMILGAKEVKNLGHSLSSRGISVLPDRMANIKSYPSPTNLWSLRHFIGITRILRSVCPRFFPACSPPSCPKENGSQVRLDRRTSNGL